MTDLSGARPSLDADRLRESAVEVVAETASTNALLTARARDGAPHGTAVAAEVQTAGRGRLDRSWQAPPGAGLTFSVLLRPHVPAAQWPWLPLVAGVAVASVLRERGYDARLKWPNDVLLAGPAGSGGSGAPGKVAGILVERVETDAGAAAIVGIGLNVSTTAAELPVPTATSLALARPGDVPGRSELLAELVGELRARHDAWQSGGAAQAGGSAVRAAYRELCATLGQEVHVDLPEGRAVTGTAAAVDEHGRLVVRTAGGPVAVGAGDVVHVRPATGAGER